MIPASDYTCCVFGSPDSPEPDPPITKVFKEPNCLIFGFKYTFLLFIAVPTQIFLPTLNYLPDIIAVNHINMIYHVHYTRKLRDFQQN